MSNIFDMERFAMAPGLSYREKTLYASLAAELLVYGPYFFLHQQNSVNKVAGMIVAIIVLQIILQLVIAAFSRNRTTDERDRLIELRGYRAGYLVIASLMVIGLGMLWFHAAVGHLRLENRMVGLHFLSVFFGMLVIADITKTATQIVAYRRAL
jgi:EamA domain-containing membrane protein RarD